MNYLPIILIVVFLLGNKNSDGLSNLFDMESIMPLLSLFGVSPEISQMLSSDEIKNILSGNADIKTLIPLISTFISQMKPNSSAPAESEPQNKTPEYLNPIKDVAEDKILSTLGNYFQN